MARVRQKMRTDLWPDPPLLPKKFVDRFPELEEYNDTFRIFVERLRNLTETDTDGTSTTQTETTSGVGGVTGPTGPRGYRGEPGTSTAGAIGPTGPTGPGVGDDDYPAVAKFGFGF